MNRAATVFLLAASALGVRLADVSRTERIGCGGGSGAHEMGCDQE